MGYPLEPEMVTAEKAGECNYSGLTVLSCFTRTELPGNTQKIGTIADTGGVQEAVESNPVLEGGATKIV